MPNSQQQNSEVVPLHIDFGVHDSEIAIVVTFTLKNTSADPLLVFSPLAKMNESGLVPRHQYAYLTVVKDACVIQRTLFDVPDNIEVYLPETPLLTKIAPGKSISETIVINKPLHSDFPYRNLLSENPTNKSIPVSSAVLKLGYLTKIERLSSLQEREDALFEIDFAEGLANQEFFVSDPQELKVDISVLDFETD